MRNPFPLLCLAMSTILVGGCAHRAPHAITLPGVAAVRAPLVAAKNHVDRSAQIGQQEAALIAAAMRGSRPADHPVLVQLSALVADDQAHKVAGQNQLTAALYEAGSLQTELDAKQRAFDAVERDRAAAKVQLARVRQSRFHWQGALLALVMADFFVGGQIQTALRWLAAAIWRVGVACLRHALALWPVLLAAI